MPDLKRNSHEKQGTLLGEAPDSEAEDYFYGLTFSLEDPELQKVPITSEMVGKEIPFEIVARVESFTDSDEGKSARLQIRQLYIVPPPAERESELYSGQ